MKRLWSDDLMEHEHRLQAFLGTRLQQAISKGLKTAFQRKAKPASEEVEEETK